MKWLDKLMHKHKIIRQLSDKPPYGFAKYDFAKLLVKSEFSYVFKPDYKTVDAICNDMQMHVENKHGGCTYYISLPNYFFKENALELRRSGNTKWEEFNPKLTQLPVTISFNATWVFDYDFMAVSNQLTFKEPLYIQALSYDWGKLLQENHIYFNKFTICSICAKKYD